MKPYRVLIALATASAALATAMSTASAKDELGAVTALQRSNTIAKAFIETYLNASNAANGPVKIKYIGGQEVVPPRKAANALKRGQFDMLSCPTAYYIGTVPEGYALLAGNQGPRALRKNGAWEILEEVYMKKAGAHLLAWGESMTSYNTYLMVIPKFRADGVPDLTGLKMRATGTYRPLFRALGASTINIKSSEIFTALQRGTVVGFGWPDVAVVALGLHKIVKYRITPNYYQTNQVLTVNPEGLGLAHQGAEGVSREAGADLRDRVGQVAGGAARQGRAGNAGRRRQGHCPPGRRGGELSRHRPPGDLEAAQGAVRVPRQAQAADVRPRQAQPPGGYRARSPQIGGCRQAASPDLRERRGRESRSQSGCNPSLRRPPIVGIDCAGR